MNPDNESQDGSDRDSMDSIAEAINGTIFLYVGSKKDILQTENDQNGIAFLHTTNGLVVRYRISSDTRTNRFLLRTISICILCM